jgi:hypothetical protein
LTEANCTVGGNPVPINGVAHKISFNVNGVNCVYYYLCLITFSAF